MGVGCWISPLLQFKEKKGTGSGGMIHIDIIRHPAKRHILTFSFASPKTFLINLQTRILPVSVATLAIELGNIVYITVAEVLGFTTFLVDK